MRRLRIQLRGMGLHIEDMRMIETMGYIGEISGETIWNKQYHSNVTYEDSFVKVDRKDGTVVRYPYSGIEWIKEDKA